MITEDQRSVTVGDKSYDAMWADVARRATISTQPKGSMTTDQFCRKFQRSTASAHHFLDSEVRAGRMTSEKLPISGEGGVRWVRFYTPVRAKKKSPTSRL
jgi:hypothetical protein